MTVTALAEWRRQGRRFRVLDVREPWEVAICALPETQNLPLGELGQRLQEVPCDLPVVVVCHHGGRSAHATRFLRARGLSQVVNLAGGIDQWARVVEPDMPVY